MRTTVKHSRGESIVEVTDLQTALSAIDARDLVVTDTNVRSATGLAGECYTIEPGEASKCLAVYGELLEWLAQRARRTSRVVALGGGVVGDLAGFAAATILRGVDLVQIPTSLLAMVDSSVGGKVGIDLSAGKNLAGAFWPPSAVHVPIDALVTLPERQFVNGCAEVWKYAAIMDGALFDRLDRRPLSLGAPDLAETVMRCIELKKSIVETDERETSGVRSILNFGHTVGHAIEHATGYRGVLHGEAVAIGMVVESLIGESLKVTRAGTGQRLARGLSSQGLRTTVPGGLEPPALLEAMRRDKKGDGNGLAFSLVSDIGACGLVTGVPENDVLRVLENL